MAEAGGDVDEHAAMLAGAFLRQMPATAQLMRCRSDLKKLYDESADAWWPDTAEDEGDALADALEAVTFAQALYAMAHGELEGTTLRVRVEHGCELVWIPRPPRKQQQPRRRGGGGRR